MGHDNVPLTQVAEPGALIVADMDARLQGQPRASANFAHSAGYMPSRSCSATRETTGSALVRGMCIDSKSSTDERPTRKTI